MSATVKICASGCYDIDISYNSLALIGEKLKKISKACTVAVITDDKVAPLYLNCVKDSLKESGFETCNFIFKNGEESKNINTFSDILEFLAQSRITRSDIIIALGGGVVGDMAGFCAAVYLRGIKFVQLPTTLLANVDSSVGGKTAIDLKAGKNLAGCFYQPSYVMCDYKTTETLDPSVFSDGMAEVIKYGVIFDKELFNLVKDGKAKNDIEYVIKRCIELKRDVVEKDEQDRGVRQLLNFGHTVGHSIEKCSGFAVTHGSAVAIGMVIAARAAYKIGWVKDDCSKEIAKANKSYNLPTETQFSAKELAKVAYNDKKRAGNSISVVIPQELGHCILKKISVSELENFIEMGLK